VNEIEHLAATSDDVNRAKTDYGPDRWRPPDRAAWCDYGRLYGETKQAYGLAVTGAQETALAELTAGCGR
jgi:hypothetical protein